MLGRGRPGGEARAPSSSAATRSATLLGRAGRRAGGARVGAARRALGSALCAHGGPAPRTFLFCAVRGGGGVSASSESLGGLRGGRGRGGARAEGGRGGGERTARARAEQGAASKEEGGRGAGAGAPARAGAPRQARGAGSARVRRASAPPRIYAPFQCPFPGSSQRKTKRNKYVFISHQREEPRFPRHRPRATIPAPPPPAPCRVARRRRSAAHRSQAPPLPALRRCQSARPLPRLLPLPAPPAKRSARGSWWAGR